MILLEVDGGVCWEDDERATELDRHSNQVNNTPLHFRVVFLNKKI